MMIFRQLRPLMNTTLTADQRATQRLAYVTRLFRKNYSQAKLHAVDRKCPGASVAFDLFFNLR
jgi:hypothetical protein